jgi:hypothetical protein
MFDPKGRFIFENFSQLKPFSNFLPGIAGLDGIPMWVFYVNRGQGISSFGTASKDYAIMEFQPANKAYRLTPTYGFRTFIKKLSSQASRVFEPFSDRTDEDSISRKMLIGMNEFEIEEVDSVAGFKIDVLYFTVPGEDFAALVRKVSIQNISETPVSIEVLDGMPVLIPYGVDYFGQANMSRTAEAWMEVFNLENGLPFFKVRASMGDTAQVDRVTSGNFAISFSEVKGTQKFLKPIVDPQAIFGSQLSFAHPKGLINGSLASILEKPQRTLGFTPCAFFGEQYEIGAGEEINLCSVYGNSSSQDKLAGIQSRLSSSYLERQREASQKILLEITQPISAKTAEPIFDSYSQQTYLDNVLRGGRPLVLPGGAIYHVFSRKHGDPERDYNFYYLAPEFYSQGNGNYRDVNQNRRSDVLFNPVVGDFNLRFFLSLLQLDGYNPLEIRGTKFVISKEDNEVVLSSVEVPSLAEFLSQPFTPGSLVQFIQSLDSGSQVSVEEVFELVFPRTRQIIDAVHGEGFWMDHWTYNLDLLDSYQAIFPERKSEMFFGERNIPWYESYVRVQNPVDRYQRTPGGLRQYHAVVEDEEKEEEIKSRGFGQTWIQVSGEAYQSSVFEKLFILLTVKAASLDQAGMGVEMEAGKPGWYDALNGFPGLLGSSTPETFEVFRLAEYLQAAISGNDVEILLPIEFNEFLEALVIVFDEYGDDPLGAWRLTSVFRHDYRTKIYSGISGEEVKYHSGEIKTFLDEIVAYISKAIKRIEGLQPDLPPTYLYYEENQTKPGDDLVLEELEFNQVVMPDFLEGPVHALRIAERGKAGRIYQAVRQSGLYDQKLGMYKVNASLDGVTHEVGRATAFPSGWLENESVWLHMEYKYLLEVLRAGLYDEFYQDIQSLLVPFQPVERYGRSLLENSSFIASSVYPDESVQGNGFVARLSGSTAEFLSMWFEIFAGRNPFVVEEGNLQLKFEPVLAGWMFPENGVLEFTFLGHTRVIYHNRGKLDTWKLEVISMELIFHNGRTERIDGGAIPAPHSIDVREGKVEIIKVHLGDN